MVTGRPYLEALTMQFKVTDLPAFNEREAVYLYTMVWIPNITGLDFETEALLLFY